MAAAKIITPPDRLSRFGIQTCRSEAAEVDIDPARLDRRRRRRVTVHRGTVAERLRIITVKHLFVESNLAGLSIHANGEEIVAILRCGRQPDLAAHHYGSGPTPVRNLRLPFDVVRFAPMQRQ